MKSNRSIGTIFFIFTMLGVFFAISYYSVRVFIFIFSRYYFLEKFLGIILLLAEFFIIVHSIGYLLEVLSVALEKKKELKIPTLKTFPSVAIIIPSYNEPLNIVEDTLTACYNINYPNKQIYLLDDTIYEKKELDEYKKQIERICKTLKVNLFRHKWRGAKAGIINDFIDYITGNPKEGSTLSTKEIILPKYFAVFDSDQNPLPEFLNQNVPFMERDKKLAFVQTPQYYTNYVENSVSKAASLQQIIFFEYICEGKNSKNSMFCCGTNFLMSLKSFLDVGGFDETSVTEDSATSIYFHLNGWKTLFNNKVSTFGKGPEDLKNYFKQQFRWSLGTLGLFRNVIKEFLKNPFRLSIEKWWEYVLTSTYYFIGYVYFILLICPVIYLIFDLPSYFNDLQIYGVIFIPYILVMFFIFYGTLRQRGYKIKEIFLGQSLMAATFFIYAKAAFYAIINKKTKFQITSKSETSELPLKSLWIPLCTGSICLMAAFWGMNRLYFERYAMPALIVNILWCLINSSMLFSVLYFNKPKKKKENYEEAKVD